MAKSFPNTGATVGLASDRTAMTGMYAGQGFYETDTNKNFLYNGSAWVCLTPISSGVTAQESTTSTTFTDLATAGPSVTVATGTTALITITSEMFSPGGQASMASVAVSGASTIAAIDANRIRASEQSTLAVGIASSRSFILSGLTAGNNTFTMKYKVTSGTGQFLNRTIVVTGI